MPKSRCWRTSASGLTAPHNHPARSRMPRPANKIPNYPSPRTHQPRDCFPGPAEPEKNFLSRPACWPLFLSSLSSTVKARMPKSRCGRSRASGLTALGNHPAVGPVVDAGLSNRDNGLPMVTLAERISESDLRRSRRLPGSVRTLANQDATAVKSAHGDHFARTYPQGSTAIPAGEIKYPGAATQPRPPVSARFRPANALP